MLAQRKSEKDDPVAGINIIFGGAARPLTKRR